MREAPQSRNFHVPGRGFLAAVWPETQGKKQFRTEHVGLTRFPRPGILETALSGSSSVVEHRLAKARVASSSLVSRSILHFSGALEPGEEWNETIRNP